VTVPPAKLLAAAELAENIASEMAVAAAALAKQGMVEAVQALLEETRRHTVEAIRGERARPVPATLDAPRRMAMLPLASDTGKRSNV
jgi:hypothetical protein